RRAAAASEMTALEFAIAGGSYHALGAALPTLAHGERLELRRERSNAYDAFAIAVRRRDGTMLGYVPRDANQTLARLMDAGWRAEASIVGFFDFSGPRARAQRSLTSVAFTAATDGDPRLRALVRPPGHA
ncbi:MAG: HIRAN domain-containing protein, partial [Stellaceae bacterium]